MSSSTAPSSVLAFRNPRKADGTIDALLVSIDTACDPMYQLPDAQQCRTRFDHEGYLLVPQSLEETTARNAAIIAAGVVKSCAESIDRRGAGARLAYRVVTGERIKSDAPMLFELYASATLLEWVRRVTGCRSVSRSSHLRSAVNINCLATAGQQYPPHLDAIPYTVLLFLSDVPIEAGGQFLLHSLEGEVVAIQPRRGHMVLMDGARCRHGVAPLEREAWRLTMPMVFPARVVERPAGLDDYLYRR
jgi:hypothetical protein